MDTSNFKEVFTSDEVKQLRQRVAELEEEKRLLEDDCGYQMQWKREFREQLEYSQKQLAAEQLNNKRLREALKMVTNKVCWSVFTDSEETQIEEALAQPTSTEALDAYMAEKVKEIQRNASGLADMYVERGERIFTLTRQRDLAVEALEDCKIYIQDTGQPLHIYRRVADTLSTIKESDGK